MTVCVKIRNICALDLMEKVFISVEIEFILFLSLDLVTSTVDHLRFPCFITTWIIIIVCVMK